ncbi:SixA phosphatase family protein [Paenibacillus yonginensis]|uniref:SixA phosphatase family protein n=1 Tax=Paenibacillus yonginensis TaxID=1462996 RepID=UPI0009F576FC|nr:phosphoglycerate mutase family protein [Paenibacillus yonginensis]
MNTLVYFVRHADSPYAPGEERTRGLSERGESDAQLAGKILKKEGIGIFISSPYERAIQTLKPAAGHHQIRIKERRIRQ